MRLTPRAIRSGAAHAPMSLSAAFHRRVALSAYLSSISPASVRATPLLLRRKSGAPTALSSCLTLSDSAWRDRYSSSAAFDMLFERHTCMKYSMFFESMVFLCGVVSVSVKFLFT